MSELEQCAALLQRSIEINLTLEKLERSDKRMNVRQEFIDNYQYSSEIIKQKKNE